MCGIYGFASARELGEPPGDELFRGLDRLSEETEAGAFPSAVEVLADARKAALAWMSRAGILALARDPDAAERLRRGAARLRAYAASVESLVEKERASGQAHRELLNQLAVGAKDILWQIERDLLASLPEIESLVLSRAPWAVVRGWELNLILRGIDRLEVRGRDSAGIAVFARFPTVEAMERFLDQRDDGILRRETIARRIDPRLGHGAVVQPRGTSALLFSFKVASEVGRMGDNVSFLRAAIAGDRLFQEVLAEERVEIQALAHTRWASNGVVSVPNCHPVDSASLADGGARVVDSGRFVACLNGDIDNFRELLERYATERGLAVDPAITTDAKVIPLVVARHFEETGSLEEAFRRAVAEFEGSMAIALMAADRPGELLFAQKGSGQGLFFGMAPGAVAVASEMYGVVELTPTYVKAEGDRVADGEIFRVRPGARDVAVEVLVEGDFAPVAESRQRHAEITTRDINRGAYPHFFVKEITESVDSVRKTLAGKFETGADGSVRYLLGEDVLPVELVAGLREGRVREIVLIGQGTAAIAAQGIAWLLGVALERLESTVKIHSAKATELSAHGLRPDMKDVVVIAVSQSGTTTDTNRTVDMARERGAWVLAIVNRRNSDLVYKAHGVLYTSDGRDVEMSVASTKAFYAQTVAGQILALGLAERLGTLRPDELAKATADLESLPSIFERTLALEPHIASLARTWALRRRHWAVVGSGPGRIAADEIRIKLSELCYKSIAVDFLEDKKHIDLSSEPLILVCAAGAPEGTISDSVKEVAIFKAHQAIPIVFTDEGVDVFGPYAAGIVELPRSPGALGYLPTVIAGHLFGYHAALQMDRLADRVRAVLAEAVRRQETFGFGDEHARDVIQSVESATASSIVELERMILAGELDGALSPQNAVRLSRALELALGRLPMDGFTSQLGSSIGLVEGYFSCLSSAIFELSRPIDAIKHQAKTVTVGISRGDGVRAPGVLWKLLEEEGFTRDRILESHRIFISAFEHLVRAVDGVAIYRVQGLDALGNPTPSTRIALVRKLGCVAGMTSRTDSQPVVRGNKWAVLKHREIFLGYGQNDGRKILILPALDGDGESAHIVLFHIQLERSGEREARLRALRARGTFLDRLQAAITELDLDWDPALIDAVDNDTLFLLSPERVAEELAQTRV